MKWDKFCVYCLVLRVRLKINKWGGEVGHPFWDD